MKKVFTTSGPGLPPRLNTNQTATRWLKAGSDLIIYKWLYIPVIKFSVISGQRLHVGLEIRGMALLTNKFDLNIDLHINAFDQ